MTGIPVDGIVDLQKALYESRNPTRRWLHTSRRDRIIELISQAHLCGYERALEVGPGSGVYLPTLCSRFREVTALDIEPRHLRALQPMTMRFSNLHLESGELATVPWEDRFDLVLCSEVLEHTTDPQSFLEALSRVIVPGGLLILSTPQPWSTMELACRIGLSKPMIGLVRMIYQEPVLPTGHISLVSRSRLLRMFLANRLTVLHTETFGFYVPLLAEFAGAAAVGIEEASERFLRSVHITWPMWTQLHIVRNEER
jgi:2-polyprenyl-3-methyl-5-hydroxy-6-metoxy-1,4-benzoquinol methylase